MDDLFYNLRLLWENFAPRRCEVCGKIIHEGAFCPLCRGTFYLQKEIKLNFVIDNVYLLFKYETTFRDLMRAIKFQNSKKYLYFLREEAMLAAQEFATGKMGKYDLITWIPTSFDRKKIRNFEVPQKIFDFFPKDKYQQVLIRQRATAPLFSFNKNEREKELAGCFSLQKDVQNKKILLVDDIYTTGSTAREAARTLKQGGALAVDMLAFASAKANWFEDN